MEKIRTIFIGTPSFSIEALKSLIKDPVFEIIAVISQPDKAVGRKKILTPTPVKIEAEKSGIRVMQPANISAINDELRALNPDLIVVIAYAQLIPEKILSIPKYGCINIHASLLPKYRGASVLQAPILNGDAESGITIMKMDKGLDTGPIISQAKIDLDKNETPISLAEKLSRLGADILIPSLKKYISGEIIPRKQDDEQANYVKTLTKEDGKIDWNDSSIVIERKVRAMKPWPGTWTVWNGKTIKIIDVEPDHHIINAYRTGTVFCDNGKMTVQTGINALIVKRLQLEGKNAMDSAEFLRGNKDILHAVLT